MSDGAQIPKNVICIRISRGFDKRENKKVFFYRGDDNEVKTDLSGKRTFVVSLICIAVINSQNKGCMCYDYVEEPVNHRRHVGDITEIKYTLATDADLRKLFSCWEKKSDLEKWRRFIKDSTTLKPREVQRVERLLEESSSNKDPRRNLFSLKVLQKHRRPKRILINEWE